MRKQDLEKILQETQEVLADRAEEAGFPRELSRWAAEKKSVDDAIIETYQRLFLAAGDREIDFLEDLAIRAGILWRCPECADVNFTQYDECNSCPGRRP